MITMLLPEVRSYLEQLLDDALVHTGITIQREVTRERMLCQLQDELIQFIFMRLMAAFPPYERGQFVALLEQEASNEVLEAFTERHLCDIPGFVARVFREFRANFLHERRQ